MQQLRCAVVLATLLQAFGRSPLTLPLERKVALLGDAAAPIPKTYYVGKITVGDATEPQDMLVSFETASGSVVLDSTRCKSPACLKHHRYSPSQAVDLDRFGTVVAHGELATLLIDYNEEGNASGSVVGDMIQDKVCLGTGPSSACADFGMLAAENMTDDPFLELPIDGIVGLSMKGLSISSRFNFMDRLSAATGMPSKFALFLPPNGDTGMGEVSFGGHNEARLASNLSWAPVHQPGDGFWQVGVTAVRIGTEQLDMCKGGCRAIIDSSSSHISVPSELMPSMLKKLAATAPKGWFSEKELCEQAQGQDLHFVLDSGAVLTLAAKDYLRQEGKACVPQLHPLAAEERKGIGMRTEGGKVVIPGAASLNILVLGEPLLRKYYTVFDSEEKRVGFGLAKTEGNPTEEIILMQGKVQRKRPGNPTSEL